MLRVASSGELTLHSLTLANGKITINLITATTGVGGGIYNEGALTITKSTLRDSWAESSGGGIYNIGTLAISTSTLRNSTAALGGGIFNAGSVTESNSILHNNVAGAGFGFGGGIYNNDSSTLIITNSTLSENVEFNIGGAVLNRGSLTVVNSTLYSNGATFQGGGVANFSALVLHNSILADSSGGDCFNAGTTVEIEHTLIQDTGSNACGLTAADLDGNGNIIGNDPLLGPLQDNGGPTATRALLNGSPAINAGDNALTVEADGATSLSTDQRGPGFPRIIEAIVDMGAYEASACDPFPRTAMDEAELNDAIGCYRRLDALGVYTIFLAADIALSASTLPIDNDTPGVELVIEGAGFIVDGQGIIGVRPFEIEADTTVTLQNIEITGGNVSDSGGGILRRGSLIVTHSTVSGNVAEAGGGVYTLDGSTTAIINSTVSGNSATTEGGGILNGGDMTMTHATLSGNGAGIEGGGIHNVGTLDLDNSIVANSSGGDCVNAGGTVTVQHTLIEESANACGASDGVDGNIVGQNPLLGPLQDNGGPTKTHALQSGSPAIHAASTGLAVDESGQLLTTDQRGEGFPRIRGPQPDMGAFELFGLTEVQLQKFVKPDGETTVGEPFDFILFVDNRGPGYAYGSQVSGLLSANGPYGFASGHCMTDQGYAVGSTRFSCALGTLEPGEQQVFTITVMPEQAMGFESQVSVAAGGVDANPVDNEAVVEYAVSAAADLAVSITTDRSSVTAGEEIDYIVEVRNRGPVTAHHVELQNVMSSQAALGAANSAGGSCLVHESQATARCGLGNLAPDGVVTVSVRALINAATPDGAIATSGAAVTSASYDPDNANDRASVSIQVEAVPMRQLRYTVAASAAQVAPGQVVSYLVKALNVGTTSLPNVRTDVALGEGLVYVSDSANCGMALLGCSLGDIGPGQQKILEIVVQVPADAAGGTGLTTGAQVATDDSATEIVSEQSRSWPWVSLASASFCRSCLNRAIPTFPEA